MVIGGGIEAGLAARGVAGFFLGVASAAVRRAAGTGFSAGGSSGTGLGPRAFGGEARRGNSGHSSGNSG
jgi:hypothetical protein